MNRWIRVDSSSPTDPKFGELGRHLGVRAAEAFGLSTAVWCSMGEHAVDGDISSVDDGTLERWAMWDGKRGKFATAFRSMFTDEQGIVRGWRERQGKLAEQMERDRRRHRVSGNGTSMEDSKEGSGEVPRKLHGGHLGNSAATVRNDTNYKPPNPLAPVGANGTSGASPPVAPAVLVPGTKRGLVPTADEEAVLTHYRGVHPRRKAVGDKVVRAIRSALRNYSVGELCEAITGNADDVWHRDKNKHELTYVLRDSDSIDSFREKHRQLHAPLKDTDPDMARAWGVIGA